MDGVLSKGVTLSHSATSTGTYSALADLINFPDLGGNTDSVEITTLGSGAHEYMDGIENYGESLDFTFLHRPGASQFQTLNSLTGAQYWKVTFPDSAALQAGTTCSFTGSCSVKMTGKTYNNALEYVLSIKPSSKMNWTYPAGNGGSSAPA